MAAVKRIQSNDIYQLKISLKNTKPEIWRRVLVDSTVKLPDLHKIIQTVMGWTNSHLHLFVIGRTSYGLPYDEGFDDVADYRKVLLSPPGGLRGGCGFGIT